MAFGFDEEASGLHVHFLRSSEKSFLIRDRVL